MSLRSLFQRHRPATQPAELIYLEIVRQARRPVFYTGYGVPDSLDGRFDMIVLHTVLTLLRLKPVAGADGPSKALSQALFDMLFADMDRSLREMGVGDLGVGRRVKQMGKAVYGRLAAYETALAGPDADLQAAVARNLYGTVTPDPAHVTAMAAYMRAAAAHLAGLDPAGLALGRVSFPEPENR